MVASPIETIDDLLDRPTVSPPRPDIPRHARARFPMHNLATDRELAVEAVQLERRFGSFVAVDKVDLAVRQG